MKDSKQHPSVAAVHKKIERYVLDQLEADLGKLKRDAKLQLDGCTCEPDGFDENETVFVEVYASDAILRSAHGKKIGTDILKLGLIGRLRPEARLLLVFSNRNTMDSLTGWMARAAKELGIETRFQKIPQVLIDELQEAKPGLVEGMKLTRVATDT